MWKNFLKNTQKAEQRIGESEYTMVNFKRPFIWNEDPKTK